MREKRLSRDISPAPGPFTDSPYEGNNLECWNNGMLE
jgi:hypothetical protein